MKFINKTHQLQYDAFLPCVSSKKEHAIMYLLTSIGCSNEIVSRIYAFDIHRMEYNQELFHRLNEMLDEKKRMIVAIAFNLFNGEDITKELKLSQYNYGINLYSICCVLGKELKMVNEALAILED